MFKNTLLALGTSALAIFVAGCTTTPEFDNLVVEAKYTTTPVKVDGKLDDAVWENATAYSFNSYNEACLQNGLVKFAWDKNYVYVGAELIDDDVVSTSKEDQSHLYKTGDVLEVFLKPSNDTYYWEIYGNPEGARSSLFFPSGGRILFPEADKYLMPDLKVGSKIAGTLNNWTDRDCGWSVEIAIPIKELTRYGAKVNEESIWRFLIGRYNYSRWLEKAELSGITDFKDGEKSFHYKPSYGYMKFVK